MTKTLFLMKPASCRPQSLLQNLLRYSLGQNASSSKAAFEEESTSLEKSDRWLAIVVSRMNWALSRRSIAMPTPCSNAVASVQYCLATQLRA